MPERLNIDTEPATPTLASTRFGVVAPATTFRFDATGRSAPVGQTETNESAVGLVAVTLSTTASTPLAGTPPRPTTGRSNVSSGPIGRPGRARPSMVGRFGRVSNNRAGTTGTKPSVVGK